MKSTGLAFSLIMLLLAEPAVAKDLPLRGNDIIVVGEKAPRSLQNVTTSTVAVTAAEIQNRDLVGVSDVFKQAANVAPVYGTSGFSIRGIPNIGVSGGGDAPTASVYVDDAPYPYTVFHAAPTDLWDVERVEVFRGPQSTLQGLNALAGAVIIRTVAPTSEWSGLAQAKVGDAGDYGIALAGGGPLVRDELALRLSVQNIHRRGFVRNITRASREDGLKQNEVRTKLLWQPAALQDFTAQLGYTYFSRDGGYSYVYIRTDQPRFPSNRISTDDTPNETKVRAHLASLNASWGLGSGKTLRSITSWSDVKERTTTDTDYSPVNAAYVLQNRRNRTFTQELRLDVGLPELQAVFGGFYYRRQLTSVAMTRALVPTPTGTIASLLLSGGLPAPTASAIASAYALALPNVQVDFAGEFPSRVESAALFSDVRLQILPRLFLVGGLRFDREINRTATRQASVFSGTLPNPAAFGAFAPAFASINSAVGAFVGQANANLPFARRRFNAWLPKVGLKMDWSNDVTTAFVVQRGYRSGGISANVARGQAFAYDPESLWNYELSLRSRVFGGRLTLNANLFYTDWQRQQILVNFGLNTYDFHTVNAAKSHLYGFELQGTYQPVDSLTFFGELGHVKTKFERFQVPVVGRTTDLTGQEFSFAPKWTLTAGATYRRGRFDASLTAAYRSRSYAAVGPTQTSYRVRGYALVDAKVGYQAGNWEIFLFGKNLLNEQVSYYRPLLQPLAVLSDPRILGVGARLAFER